MSKVLFYIIHWYNCNKVWTSGNAIIKIHFKKYKKRTITIGVKSKGQKFVGIIFFTKLYIGSIISAINWGLKFIPKTQIQDKITSIITIMYKMSKKI